MIGPFDPTPIINKFQPTSVSAPGGIESNDKTPKAEKTQPAEETQKPTNTPQEKKEALKDSQSTESIELRELKARDREVRAHEQAHLSAAGQYARGGASFDFKRGADGQLYAVGGEVQIDTSPIANDPLATLQKAEIIRQAALAPTSPSSADRQIAAAATSMASQARADLSKEQLEEQQDNSSNNTNDSFSEQLNQRLAKTGAVTTHAGESLLNALV